MYSRPTEGTINFVRQKFANKPDIAEANITAFKAGWNFGETTEAFGVSYEVKPATVAERHLPQHQRQPGAGLRADRRRAAGRAAAVPRRLPDHPGERHPARAVQAQALRRAHVPGRGRDRRHRQPRSARRSAVRWPSPQSSGPGIALKGETIGLAVVARAAADHLRHPARRPVHRPADQDRAVRPAAGDVRPQRRGAGADRRAAVAGRLLRRRGRGRADRADLPHAGVPALGRLPGQRLRAVAGPVRRRAARPARSSSPPSPTAPAPRRACSCPTCATPRRWPARGRCRAPPGLEHRIGGIEKADRTGNITYDPDNHDFMVAHAAGQGRRHRPLAAADGGRRPRRRRPRARARLGLDLRPDRRGLPPGARRRRLHRPGAPAPPQPVPATTSARSSPATTGS